jgi:hypothetical protein
MASSAIGFTGRPRRIASATRTTRTISATSCTRTTLAPCNTAAVTAAAVPSSR